MSSPLPPRLTGLPVLALTDGLALVEAATIRSRLWGLGGLAALPPDWGLEIPARSVHTFTMRFALDLIWLSADGRVVRVDRNVARRRIRACWAARSVVETNAGQADGFATALGRR